MPEFEDYAVFGHPISHSKSPRIHHLFAEQTDQEQLRYRAWDVPAANFNDRINEFIDSGGKGLNCTVPLKELAFKVADAKSPSAMQCGAVNTLSVRDGGLLYGDNTDGTGLVRDLKNNLGLELGGSAVLVLGAGGASRGILGPVLDCDPAQLVVANRTPAKAQKLVQGFNRFSQLSGGGMDELSGKSFDLIVNATAASLSNNMPSLPPGLLKPGGICYDLAYGDSPTPFVKWGKAQGASISVDGLGMLVEQAAEAFRIWRGLKPDTQSVIRELRRSGQS